MTALSSSVREPGLAKCSARSARFRGALTVAGVLIGCANAYQLTLLMAARSALRRRSHDAAGGSATARELELAVLVPAHDEEQGIAQTLASLAAQDYPGECFEVVVVADNCVDRTAAVAAAAGATVYERTDPANRGKGQALSWALEHILRGHPGADAVVVVDADCVASRDLLATLARHLAAGAQVVQVNYAVSNPGESRASALRFAAFSLINTVRPLGKARLGLSCGLLGSGMAFSRQVLMEHPWNAFSLVEDAEYHATLVAAEIVTTFAPEASVSSPMPTKLGDSATQQARWESGHASLARGWSVRLLRRAIQDRDVRALHAALEPLMPPQSMLAVGEGSVFLAASLAGARVNRTPQVVVAMDVIAHAAFVLGGLATVRAPRAAYEGLLLAPALAAQKLWLYARALLGRSRPDWIRTVREG